MDSLRKLVKPIKPKIHLILAVQIFKNAKIVKDLEKMQNVGLKRIILCGRWLNLVQLKELIKWKPNSIKEDQFHVELKQHPNYKPIKVESMNNQDWLWVLITWLQL